MYRCALFEMVVVLNQISNTVCSAAYIINNMCAFITSLRLITMLVTHANPHQKSCVDDQLV